jgi:multidrug transporter EmrE-like cation transporter
LIASVLLAACGHLMIKHGLNTVPAFSQTSLAARILEYLLTPWVIAGLAVYGVGTLLWIVVASKRDISYLYPITALNYVLITVGGMWLFGEAVSARRWLGILVVMTGVAALQISGGERKP